MVNNVKNSNLTRAFSIVAGFVGKHKFLLCLWLISITIYHRWLSFGYFSWGDKGYLDSSTATQYLNPSTWIENYSLLGHNNVELWRIPQQLLSGIIGYIGFDSRVIDAVVYYYPIIFLLPFAGYLFVKQVTGSRLAGFFGSLVISFNTYFLAIDKVGHLGLTLACTFGILALYVFIRIIEQERLNLGLAAVEAFFLACVCSYDLRICYLTIIVLVIVGGLRLVFTKENRRSIAKNSIWTLSLFSALSAYWVLPTLFSNSFTDSELLSRPLIYSGYWTILDTLTIHHPFWDGTASWFEPTTAPWYLIVLPILAIIGTRSIVKSRNTTNLSFALIAVIGVFSAKQVSQPFGEIYQWMFTHFVGFSAFREATKFYYLIIISYGVLIGIAALRIREYIEASNLFRFRFPMMFIATAILLLATVPITTGSIKSLYVQNPPSKENSGLNNIIKQKNTTSKYSKTLLVPTIDKWLSYSPSNSMYDLTLAQEGYWYKRIKYPKDTEDPFGSILNQNFSSYLLNIHSIDRVIVPPDPKSRISGDYSVYFKKDRSDYVKQVDNLSYLRKDQSLKAQGYDVYYNYNAKPYIRTSSNLLIADDVIDAATKSEFIESIGGGTQEFVKNDQISRIPSGLLDIKQVFREVKASEINNGSIEKNITLDSGDTIFYTGARLTVDYNNKTISIIGGVGSDTIPGSHERIIIDNPGTYKLKYTDSSLYLDVDDSTFKSVAQSQKVSDCNNYDDKSDIGISIVENADPNGSEAFQLTSRHHMACTSATVNVTEGKDYVLGFDYKITSPGSEGGYYVEYNDDKKTFVSDVISDDSKVWASVSKSVQVPYGATQAKIIFYAHEPKASKTNDVSYKNIVFAKIPDTALTVWTKKVEANKLVQPRSIDSDVVSETRKEIHIKGARGNFYLLASELYTPNWHLYGKGYAQDGIWQLLPFGLKEAIPAGDHFRLNDIQNGWYVRIDTLCKNDNLCQQNNDGTYDLELIAEFTPQRWLYIGLSISGIVLAVILILVVVTRRRCVMTGIRKIGRLLN